MNIHLIKCSPDSQLNYLFHFEVHT